MNAYIEESDISAAINTGDAIIKRYPDSFPEKLALYYLTLASLNNLDDIQLAREYTGLLKQNYPNDYRLAQKIGRHSSIKITMDRYGQMSLEEKMEKMKKLRAVGDIGDK